MKISGEMVTIIPMTTAARATLKPIQFNRWVKVLGEENQDLERSLSSTVRRKIDQGEFTDKDVNYVASLERPLLPGELTVSASRLEKLRRLCQLWDVDLRVTKIESHRKVIGPFIVAAKTMLIPVLRAIFKDMIRQQREFNAEVIKLLADLSNEIDKIKR